MSEAIVPTLGVEGRPRSLFMRLFALSMLHVMLQLPGRLVCLQYTARSSWVKKRLTIPISTMDLTRGPSFACTHRLHRPLTILSVILPMPLGAA